MGTGRLLRTLRGRSSGMIWSMWPSTGMFGLLSMHGRWADGVGTKRVLICGRRCGGRRFLPRPASIAPWCRGVPSRKTSFHPAHPATRSLRVFSASCSPTGPLY